MGTTHWPAGDTSTGGNGATVDNVPCGATNDNYHVHTHVSIFLNGEPLAIPGHIGIVGAPGNCTYDIHTHDSSGKIHVEAAATGTFTLGQLFDIWGEPLTNTNVAGLTGMPIVIYSTDAGVVTQVADTDWTNLELKSHREITIVVGTPITEIPNFTWTAM